MAQQVVIEMQGVDKATLSRVWTQMREGEALTGDAVYIGRSMADHPEWFPIFETLDVLGGDDTLPNGENPIAHVTFHILVGSQIFHQQRHLAWTAQQRQTGLDLKAYGQTLKSLAPLKTKRLWERLGHAVEPEVHGRKVKRKR